MKLTNNQKAMSEIAKELAAGYYNLYLPEGKDYGGLTASIDGKYLCITLHDGDITINKRNRFDEDLIIQAVKNSSFIGGLVVPTTYKIN